MIIFNSLLTESSGFSFPRKPKSAWSLTFLLKDQDSFSEWLFCTPSYTAQNFFSPSVFGFVISSILQLGQKSALDTGKPLRIWILWGSESYSRSHNLRQSRQKQGPEGTVTHPLSHTSVLIKGRTSCHPLLPDVLSHLVDFAKVTITAVLEHLITLKVKIGIEQSEWKNRFKFQGMALTFWSYWNNLEKLGTRRR